jgi:hypothetical protein
MSERERWIVYPMLFLAVMLAAVDKIVPRGKTRFDEVVCKQLRAQEILCTEMRTVSSNGQSTLVRLGTTPFGGGEVHVYSWETPQPGVMLRADSGGVGLLRATTLECSTLHAVDRGRGNLAYLGPALNGEGTLMLHVPGQIQPAVVLSSDEEGGYVYARSRDGAWSVALGHVADSLLGPLSGIFGVYDDRVPIMIHQGDERGLWGIQFPRPEGNGENGEPDSEDPELESEDSTQ